MPHDPKELREFAREAERSQDWEKAYKYWQDVSARVHAPDRWDRFFLARAATISGRIEEALGMLQGQLGGGAVAADDAFAAAVMLRAQIEEIQGRHEPAIQWWRKAADLHDEPYWALFGLARSLHRTGKIGPALDAIAAAMTSPLAEQGGASFAATLFLQDGSPSEAEAVLTALNFTREQSDRVILRALPGMTSFDERWALREIARLRLSGAGEIVDLGCWLGSLTASLAAGARENSKARVRRKKIHAYDTFVWVSNYMDANWKRSLTTQGPANDENFLPAFRKVTSPWEDRIQTHIGNLVEVRWTGEPIEFLSVDAMKSEELARGIISEFFPALIAGKSYLFHQDFCHDHTWWIHIYHFLLRDHFALSDSLEGSAGVLFEVVRPIKDRDVARAVAADLSDSVLASEAFAFSMEQVTAPDRGPVAAAHARCEMSNGRA